MSHQWKTNVSGCISTSQSAPRGLFLKCQPSNYNPESVWCSREIIIITTNHRCLPSSSSSSSSLWLSQTNHRYPSHQNPPQLLAAAIDGCSATLTPHNPNQGQNFKVKCASWGFAGTDCTPAGNPCSCSRTDKAPAHCSPSCIPGICSLFN